jgi:hypothetical protein
MNNKTNKPTFPTGHRKKNSLKSNKYFENGAFSASSW